MPPGSGMDAMSRVIAQELGDRLKQTVLIDNKAGANGTLGSAALVRATPDGYTLGMGNSGTHGSSPNLMKSVPYDPVKNFEPIGRIGSFIFMLTVHSSRAGDIAAGIDRLFESQSGQAVLRGRQQHRARGAGTTQGQMVSMPRPYRTAACRRR